MTRASGGPITADMLISDVLERFPEVAVVFTERGLSCPDCGAALFEKVCDGSRAHGIDVDDLLASLNDALSESSENANDPA